MADDTTEQKTERFNMFMTPSEMGAIDDWAWENKIRSKSEAVRRLVQIGLAFDQFAGEIHADAANLVHSVMDLEHKHTASSASSEAEMNELETALFELARAGRDTPTTAAARLLAMKISALAIPLMHLRAGKNADEAITRANTALSNLMEHVKDIEADRK